VDRMEGDGALERAPVPVVSGRRAREARAPQGKRERAAVESSADARELPKAPNVIDSAGRFRALQGIACSAREGPPSREGARASRSLRSAERSRPATGGVRTRPWHHPPAP